MLAGAGMATIYTALDILRIILHHNIIADNIIDFVFAITCGVVYMILTSYLCMGIYRIYLMVMFGIGYAMFALTLGKMFAKLNQKLYNWAARWIHALLKSKYIKPLTK